MTKNKKKEAATEQHKEKPTPAYLQPDYPYQAASAPVENPDSLETGVLYEIWCNQCQMSIRSQGQNIKSRFEKMKESGCIGCGNKDLEIRRVNMTANAEGNRKS